jgi:hypothetical protein
MYCRWNRKTSNNKATSLIDAHFRTSVFACCHKLHYHRQCGTLQFECISFLCCFFGLHTEYLKIGTVHYYLLTPWHYSPDGHKPPLIRFHSLILVYLRSRWLTCCHNTFSNQPDSTTRAIWQRSRRISRVRNRKQEIWPTKHLTHAV